MSRMNRKQYRKARQIIRENGLRWLTKEAAEVMDQLRTIKDSADHLAEREWFSSWCKRNGKEYNIRRLRQLAHTC